MRETAREIENRGVDGVVAPTPAQDAETNQSVATSNEILVINVGKVKLCNGVSVYVGAILLHDEEAGWYPESK